jgi:DNA-directed RNA polymerase subunit RPC12/RpoP
LKKLRNEQRIWEFGKFWILCIKPHRIGWGSLQQGCGCPHCNRRIGVNNRKHNIEFIRKEFAKEGYILLTKIYEDAKQKLDYICSSPEKHHHSTTWSGWKSGSRCPYCNGNGKPTIEHIRAEFEKKGYILLTTVYEDSKQKLEYICPNGHQRFINWNDWQQGKGCPCLSNRMRPTIESIRADFAKEGYILLTEVYENNKQKLEYICPRGHRGFISWHSWNSKVKRRCPKCNDSHVSKWEKTIRKFLSESNIDYVGNDKTQLLNPETNYNLELDIWFPDLNKAIECNGIYWHSKKRAIKNDKIKTQLCKDQGINLLVITDEEWNKDIDKCKIKIKNFVTGE